MIARLFKLDLHQSGHHTFFGVNKKTKKPALDLGAPLRHKQSVALFS
jgi:hypothetical protein